MTGLVMLIVSFVDPDPQATSAGSLRRPVAVLRSAILPREKAEEGSSP
jgi:hypothetical protein